MQDNSSIPKMECTNSWERGDISREYIGESMCFSNLDIEFLNNIKEG